MASLGYYENPGRKRCFQYCAACTRCADKGRYAKCVGCSGRIDPLGMREPDIDDRCRCTEGILQVVTKKGQFLQGPYKSDPFEGRAQTIFESEDERDWNSYLKEMREKLDNEYWNPVETYEDV